MIHTLVPTTYRYGSNPLPTAGSDVQLILVDKIEQLHNIAVSKHRPV